MENKGTCICIVQGITLYRLLFAVFFLSATGLHVPSSIVAVLYLAAMCSDVADGWLARIMCVQSEFGRVLDLIADKSLTFTSLLYAASHGISPASLGFIAARDVVMIGLRLVFVDQRQLLPTNRLFGGLMSALVWGATLMLMLPSVGVGWMPGTEQIFGLVGILAFGNLVHRIAISWGRIRHACFGPDARTTMHSDHMSGGELLEYERLGRSKVAKVGSR